MPKSQIKKKTLYVGWSRKDAGSPWRRIVHDTDETRAFNRLLDRVRGGDKMVLKAGENPNAREQS